MQRTTPHYKQLFMPFFVVLIIGFIYYFTSPFIQNFGSSLLDKTRQILAYAIAILSWLTATWFACRCIDYFLWERLIYRQWGIRIPLLVKETLHFILYFSVILSLFAFLFHQSILGLLAASGAVSLILGLSLENLIADLFYGIVISIDKPFEPGDELTIHTIILLPINLKVIGTSWRSTSFYTDSKTILTIPNSQLADMTMTIQASNSNIITPSITLADNIPSHRILRLMEAASLLTDGIHESLPPNAYIEKNEYAGITYTAKIYLNKKADPLQAKHTFYLELIHLIKTADIPFFIPKQITINKRRSEQDTSISPSLDNFFEQINFLQALTEREQTLLMEQIKVRHYRRGEYPLTIDDDGSSMFIVKEGILDILIRVPNQEALSHIAYYAPGSYLGEMSLFTGEKRTATAVCMTDCTLIEITKPLFEKIFSENRSLMNTIGRLIAKRQLSTISHIAHLDRINESHLDDRSYTNMVDKIKHYFFGDNK